MADPKTKIEVIYNHVLEEVGVLIERIEQVNADLSSVDGQLKKTIDEYVKTAAAMRQFSKAAADKVLQIQKNNSFNQPQEKVWIKGVIVTCSAAALLIAIGVEIGLHLH